MSENSDVNPLLLHSDPGGPQSSEAGAKALAAYRHRGRLNGVAGQSVNKMPYFTGTLCALY